MTPIHPTAIVDPKAEIDPSVEIGPYVIIEGPVQIGPRTKIFAHAHLCGNTVIGADNEIHMGCVIGHTPQHLGYRGQPTGVRIGDGNVFREYVTIHRGSEEGSHTVVGDRCYFMAMSHIAHDAVVGNEIIVANGTLLAGHVHIEDKVVLSGNVGIHQHCRIGTLAMIGGLSKIVQDIPPYMLVDGSSKVCGINVVGLRRAGFDARTQDLGRFGPDAGDRRVVDPARGHRAGQNGAVSVLVLQPLAGEGGASCRTAHQEALSS